MIKVKVKFIVCIVFYSFMAIAENEFNNIKVDSFDIEIAKNYHHAVSVKKNAKSILYSFRKSIVIHNMDKKTNDTIYYEDVQKIRRGFLGQPLLKVVFKYKKEPFIISFRHRQDFETFYETLKTKEVKRYNSSFWEYSYLISMNIILIIGIIL